MTRMSFQEIRLLKRYARLMLHYRIDWAGAGDGLAGGGVQKTVDIQLDVLSGDWAVAGAVPATGWR
ncbi:hypothetical protein NGI13_22275 [Enterobacter asburiae]|uniref:hypothetical protein n=1 Tax=Enterobacter TaxID=547 RepID=UPI000B0F9A67|nr:MULTISPECIES: hypothetical protein [Enterobacter]MEB8258281.1 hypothetical protein [Enterobacter asburiae]